jgi:hypothetical protein
MKLYTQYLIENTMSEEAIAFTTTSNFLTGDPEKDEKRKAAEKSAQPSAHVFGASAEGASQNCVTIEPVEKGGRAFRVSADPNKAEVDKTTGVATIYPNGKDKEPNTHFSVRSTERGHEVDFSTIPKTASVSCDYGRDGKVLLTMKSENGKFDVDIKDKEAFQKHFDKGMRHTFKNPEGQIVTLNREGELVSAGKNAERLFGKAGAERQAELKVQEQCKQLSSTMRTPIASHGDDTQKIASHVPQVRGSQGAGLSA